MFYRRKRTVKVMIYMISIFILFLIVFYKIDRDIRPVLFSVSSMEVKITATESINRIVKEELSGEVDYENFVNIKTDKNGDISAIELNTIEMNKFSSKVALRVQEEMKSIGERGVDIPIGVITGSSLLSHCGPKIKAKVLPVGYVICDFKSELEPSGINQTRYMVYINVVTNLQIMIPLGREKMDVASKIPVVETLIVGKVPSSYFNSTSGSSEDSSVVPVPIPIEK